MEIIEIIGITALVVIVVFVIGIIIYGEIYGKKAVVKRKLEKTVSKRISEFKDGEVNKFIGNIEIIDPLLAPISGKECSYYYINIEERVRVNSGSKTWETIIEEELSNKLLIKDGNKYAYINDKNMNSFIIDDKRFSSGFLNDAHIILEKYLNKHGHKSTGTLGMNKNIRYKEGVLEKDEKVAVFGKGEWQNAEKVGLPSSYGKVLVITAPGNDGVYLSDKPETTEN